VRILIVDDHAVMREGVRVSLRDLDATLAFVEAADLAEAMQAARSHPSIDLVLFDLALPGVSSIEALMVKGRSVKQIARELAISTATVKAHLQPILRSIGAMNRTEAIVALHRLGYSLKE
jgi:DNA-binding NarL/FixJ family response regulator